MKSTSIPQPAKRYNPYIQDQPVKKTTSSKLGINQNMKNANTESLPRTSASNAKLAQQQQYIFKASNKASNESNARSTKQYRAADIVHSFSLYCENTENMYDENQIFLNDAIKSSPYPKRSIHRPKNMPKSSKSAINDTVQLTKINRRIENKELQKTRILSGSAISIPHWESVFLEEKKNGNNVGNYWFEFVGKLDSIIVFNDELEGNEFTVKDSLSRMKCIYYEFGSKLEKIPRDQLVRCIGKMNKKLGNKLFQCVHVAAVQESDYVAHGHLVNATNVYLKKTY